MTDDKTARTEVEILRCSQHGVWAVAIDSTRVTSKKCCGSWTTVASFRVPTAEIEKQLYRAREE